MECWISCNVEVNVSLKCKVDRVVPPPSLPSMFSASSPRYRNPSYFRRQVRRKAASESQNLLIENHAADQVIDINTDESIEKWSVQPEKIQMRK